jgi:hypothetical protein
MDSDSKRMLKLPIRKKLDTFFFFCKARLKQEIGGHHRILRETIEVPHMDDGKVFFERGTKPSFGKPTLEGHLASLKTRFGSSPGTGILAFGPPAGSFAVTRSNASSHSLFLFSRSLRRSQFV